ncbi:DUF1186 domain-containing protein [Chlamydiifrater phoenicopteri]|uniref:DUF1186 domain-containing protein n=1 Tax=Chlamydiifrater phoenicopteri TaxID=2681469 RepID=UPI001BCC9AE5|nr:DUF1186 domain-containing protein [Chlamydiifrater phoenicopteri]
MDISHILEDLAYDEGILPREAIEAAIVKQKQITPYLLNILTEATRQIPEIIEDRNYQGHLYAMYLLAQFRETRALPLIVELFSFCDDTPHAIAGDVLTEDLARIMASVCNDDSYIKQLIETPGINEYVKAAALTSLTILVGVGKLDRDSLIEYFGELLNNKLERYHSFAWDNLIAASCSLYPEEIYPSIRKAFEDNLVDTAFISLEDVRNILDEETLESCLYELHSASELINDTLEEMEKWLEDFSL